MNPYGQPTKYSPDLLPIMAKVLEQGGTICMLVRELKICRQTLYTWMDTYPEVKDVVSRGREYGQAWLEERGLNNLNNQNFNAILYQMIMRNRVRWTEHRRIELPGLKDATTYEQKIAVVNKALADGELTADEANKLSNAFAQLARVEETAELKRKIEQLEQELKNG